MDDKERIATNENELKNLRERIDIIEKTSDRHEKYFNLLCGCWATISILFAIFKVIVQ